MYYSLRDFVHLWVLQKPKPFAKPPGDICRYDNQSIDKSALIQVDTNGEQLQVIPLENMKLMSLQGSWKNEKLAIGDRMIGVISESQDFNIFTPKARALFMIKNNEMTGQKYFENGLNLRFGPLYKADDHSFLALSVSYLSPEGDSYLARIDTALNMILEKKSGLNKSNNHVNSEEIIVLDDKSVYVSYLEQFNSDPQQGHLGLRKFDSLGNKLWSENLDAIDYLASRPNIVRTQDGLIAISYMKDTLKAPYFIGLVPVLMKVDTSGVEIWRSYWIIMRQVLLLTCLKQQMVTLLG